MNSKFNRQTPIFTHGRGTKGVKKRTGSGLPSSEDIEIATQAFLENGGEIERVSSNSESSRNEVYRANLEPESRLGMGTLVDESWDCWENKDFDSNPGGSAL